MTDNEFTTETGSKLRSSGIVYNDPRRQFKAQQNREASDE